jgi:hypothetical protein
MVVRLILVFVLNGQQVEMQDAREFPNPQKCEEEAERLAKIPFIRVPAGFGCIVEYRA